MNIRIRLTSPSEVEPNGPMLEDAVFFPSMIGPAGLVAADLYGHRSFIGSCSPGIPVAAQSRAASAQPQI